MNPRASTTALSVTLLGLLLSTLTTGCAGEATSANEATTDEEIATSREALSTETNDGFWIDQNPSYPGVYYKKLGGGCYRGGSPAGTYNCKIATVRTDVSYWITVDPRWPGVYYAQVNGACPSGGVVAGNNCQVVAFDQSYLDYGVDVSDDSLRVWGTVGKAVVQLDASTNGKGAYFERPLHELGDGWHCGNRKDYGGIAARDCLQLDVLVYDQPNKITFRARAKTEYLYLGTWGHSKALFDKTYSYSDPFFGR